MVTNQATSNSPWTPNYTKPFTGEIFRLRFVTFVWVGGLGRYVIFEP